MASETEQWLSYAEAGERLGIAAQAVRHLARRRGWARRTPNAYGDRALVLVRVERTERRLDEERARADHAERRLADKDATITGFVAREQELRREIETLTELARARRSWWRRVFGR
jgi:hypothetical protein